MCYRQIIHINAGIISLVICYVPYVNRPYGTIIGVFPLNSCVEKTTKAPCLHVCINCIISLILILWQRALRSLSKPSCCVRLVLDKQETYTKVIQGTDSPSWGEHSVLLSSDPSKQSLVCEVNIMISIGSIFVINIFVISETAQAVGLLCKPLQFVIDIT